MGSSLFLIIQKLLPSADPQVVSKVQLVAQSGGNGFELLWLLTKHFVPMVSVTRQLTWPVWPSNDDIYLFARRVALYCTLCRMRGQTPLTEAQRSEMFLSKVEGVHRDRAQHLLTTLRVSISTSVDGLLPPSMRLHLNDLADRLMEEYQDANGVMSTSMIHFPFSTDPAASTHEHSLPIDRHIQGYCVNVARAGSSVRRAPPSPAKTASCRGTSRTRRPPFDGNCDACGKYGHQAVTCDSLGMAIYMRLYCRDKKNKSIMDEAEQNWNKKNKKWVTESPPSKILARYCSVAGVPESQVDSELDWDMLSPGVDESVPEVGELDQAICNRVSLPSVVDWFNRSTAPTPPITNGDADWTPQTNRVRGLMDAPPGSVMDFSPPHMGGRDFPEANDVCYEEAVLADDLEVIPPPVAPIVEEMVEDDSGQGSSLSPCSAGVPTEDMASVFRALGKNFTCPLDVTECLVSTFTLAVGQ